MIKNYIKIAFRNLRKNKLYTLVNIAGLAIGIASCLLIGLYIYDELNFDTFHKNANRIVRLTSEANFGDHVEQLAVTGTKAGPQLRRTFPQIESFVRTLKYPRVVSYNNNVFDEKRFLYADSAFFNLFSFPLVSGDPKTVLDAPDKIVLTQSAARKYFRDTDPVGKMMKVGTKDFIVSGIAKDAPLNSQIRFDMVASFMALGAAQTEKWNEMNYITYLLLQNEESIKPLEKQIAGYMQSIAKNEMKMEGSQFLTFHLEPLTRVHLYSTLEGLEPNNNIIYIYILGIVALLIMLIACVNYTNLSIAQSAGRSAEVGMRKVLGASKQQIFNQFVSEALVITFFSVISALVLSFVLLPQFNNLSGKELSGSVLFDPGTLVSLIILSALITLAAGSYPALLLSGSKVINVLKSGFNFTGSGALRKTLIVFQFVISIFLIITTIIILQQLRYIHHKDLGYDKEQVMVLPIDNQLLQHYDDFKKAVAAIPGVQSVSAAYETPVNIQWGDGIHKGTTENEKEVTVNAIPVDEDFVKTLGIKILAGSDFTWSDVQQMDTSLNGDNLHYSYILNETAAKALGWKPEEAVGKTITKGNEGVVKAVVKDFHFHSLHEPITPLVIFLDKRMLFSMFVKVKAGESALVVNNLEITWKQRVTNRPFDYHFLDEDYDALYKSEQRTASVFTVFSVLAIVLACLGLFALTAFAMVKRTREIGIRKVLGASVTDILALVSVDFVKLIIVALIIAAPLTFFAISKWLDNFSYRIQISWWVFVFGGVLTLIIALVTISLQAMKTAMSNPVKSLKTE